jgi:hypothetical protein
VSFEIIEICAVSLAQGAEIHVKDFMIRHSSMLGLNNPADIRLLEKLKVES